MGPSVGSDLIHSQRASGATLQVEQGQDKSNNKAREAWTIYTKNLSSSSLWGKIKGNSSSLLLVHGQVQSSLKGKQKGRT